MQSCEIALIPQNFLLGEMFCCGALLTLRSPRTPFLDRFLIAREAVLTTVIHDLLSTWRYYA
jgi:hypothetical protein